MCSLLGQIVSLAGRQRRLVATRNYSNTATEFTPGNGMKGVGDSVSGDKSTFGHHQIGGHIARVQGLLIARSLH